MMKRMIALTLSVLMVMALLAGCGGSKGKDVTWADYQTWLKDSFVPLSPDPDGFKALVDSLKSWDDVDLTTAPWSKLLTEDGFNGSTWDEFVAAGGEGSFDSAFADNAEEGANQPSGEPSGEPTEEPAA